MFADVLLALPLGLLLAFTIGPVFFVLLETAITKGFRAAIAFNSGVVLADAVFILIVYFTTSSLLREIKDDPKLFFAGGLIMVAYGLISFIKLKKDFKKTMDNKENAHFPPIFINDLSKCSSPFVLMVTISISQSGKHSLIRSATSCVCRSANALFLLPILNFNN